MRNIDNALAAALLLAVAAPAAARHHDADRHGARHHATVRSHRATPHARRDDPRPAGATTVPAGGLKLFCSGRSGPLLVRKMTQGHGTTVTVICR